MRVRLAKAERLIALVANVTVVLGILIALLGLWNERSAGRISASLDYVDRFNEGAVLEARNTTYRAFLALGLDQLPADGLTAEAQSALIEALMATQERPGELELALVNITDFYDSLNACARTAVCDESILEAQVGPYGTRFFCFFRPYVLRVREESRVPRFGEGLEHFAAASGGCDL